MSYLVDMHGFNVTSALESLTPLELDPHRDENNHALGCDCSLARPEVFAVS